ncbi:uncharacterized protein MCYG_03740 [Microsporum canis CBS 113480]|uniref:Kazal-like domain-containing protein n=1 Tax=Arthroderma otae (strain ATCC MYA-4605 / CBS 113480) TaxID=554155 RepID=C5FJR0_ARTOC|nr:uncharacterized protein MCYG_03740 [Microsporum canis CBS 113480]EEQ30921.1 predicted protein [Microsporum canis CBS 113480]
MKFQYLLAFMAIGLSMAQRSNRPGADGCSMICTADFKPVCARGRDGTVRTFANSCELRTARCQEPAAAFSVLREGQC